MPTDVTCTVYVDGTRVADGSSSDELEDSPTALSGLQVTWGRDTTVDQPGSSQCQFTLMDPPGGQGFTDILRVGTTVDVAAGGILHPDRNTSVWPDPSFETGVVPGVFENREDPIATYTVTSDDAATGSRSLRIGYPAEAAGRQIMLQIAPAPFVPAGSDPAAWSVTPTASPGERWTIQATIKVPTGMSASYRPALFYNPYDERDFDAAGGIAATIAGNDDWQTPDPYTFTYAKAAGAWIGLILWFTPPAGSAAGEVLIDDVTIIAPAQTHRDVLVFSGRVTALESSWDDQADTPIVKVSAVDFNAELDNADVGDEPWPVEALDARFQRILDLTELGIPAAIDQTASGTLVSWRDVDSQPAGGLLAELASSVDAVLWSATHQISGPYLSLEDPSNRPAARVLEADSDGIVRIVDSEDLGGAGLPISACDVLRDDVTWTQDTQDVITRVGVTWRQQGTDDDGQPITTDVTVTVIDAALEKLYGLRRMSLSSQLQSAEDATIVAERILARFSADDWRASGLTIADAYIDDATTDDVAMVLNLLDGTVRNGLAIALTDLPDWGPLGPTVPIYLEGGTYTFQDGYWVLALNVSNASNLATVAWDDLDPTWTWDQFDPDITWDDLRGVGGPPTLAEGA